MRRFFATFCMFIGLATIVPLPAVAAMLPPLTPQLTAFGQINGHYTTLNHCLFVPYAVENAGYFELEYIGSDHAVHIASGSGRPQTGEVGICPDSSWPTGWYALRDVLVYANDSSADIQRSRYGRWSHVVTFLPDNSAQSTTLNLSTGDFWFSN